jgi:hypothetical protein
MIHADPPVVDSPLDRKLTITIFEDETAKVKREHQKSLRELAPYIDKKSAPSKAALPWLKLARFGDKRSAVSLRNDANVVSISGIEIDYDKEQISVSQAAEVFRANRVAALIYTSPSHKAAAPRWRALLPTSTLLPPVQRSRLCGVVNRILKGDAAGESFTLSQSYYYGQVGANPDHEVILIDGRYIDYADDIEPLDKTRSSKHRFADDTDEWGLGFDRIDDISDERLCELLMSIPNDGRFDDRGEWFEIGCAVKHQALDSDAAREMFYEWSVQHSSHNEAKFEKTWRSIGNYSGRPVTVRYLIKLAKGHEQKATTERLSEILMRMDFAPSLDDLRAIAADARKLNLDQMDRVRLVSSLQKNAKNYGVTLPIKEARDMVRHQPSASDIPDWLKNWVFLKHTGQFYDRKTGEHVDHHAFDAAFGRYVGPDNTASKVALNIVKIPVFHMTMYLPGEEDVFTDPSGLTWINTYRNTAPPIPEILTERDRRNVELIKDHSRHLFENQHDIEILHSSLAYVVQTGKRCNWITIIQGAEAIGKTFYAQLMAAVLGGSPHVYKLDTQTLTDSSFTEWAEGHQLVFIEELYVHGKRYNVMDKIKTYATDETVSVHPKGFRQYNVTNTATYIAFTNHRDSVPLERSDTRYFVLLSRWQSTREVLAFKESNPTYYRKLFNTIQESPGAIRGWLMNYPLHPDFDPTARAPSSHGKATMIDESKSELQTLAEDLIRDGNIPGISEELVVVHLLREALADESGVLPTPEATRAVLQRLQFTPIQGRRVKISTHPDAPRKDFYCWSTDLKVLSSTQDYIRKLIMNKLFYDEL